MNKRNAQRTLKKAKKILQTDGWTQKKWKCVDGKYCVDGAIAAAAGIEFGIMADPTPYNTLYDPLADELKRYADAVVLFARHLPDDYRDFILPSERNNPRYGKEATTDYNDRPGRTIDEVMATLDRAIAS